MNLKKLYKKIAGFMIFTYAISFSVNTFAYEINSSAATSLPNLVTAVGTTGAIDSQSSILATSAVTTTQAIYTQNEVTSSVFSMPAGTVTGQLDATIYGNTRVNLLGNDGDCEDVSKWWGWNTTLSLDQSKKIYNSSSCKITLNNGTTIGSAKISKIPQVEKEKYYLLAGYLACGDCSSIQLNIGSGDVNTPVTSKDMTFVYWKISNTYDLTGKDIGVRVVGTGSQYGYVDGLCLYEITAEEYNSLPTLTNEKIEEEYSFVNGIASTNSVRIKSIGKNLFSNKYFEDLGNAEFFNGSVSIENNKIKLVSTGDDAFTISYGHPNYLPVNLRKFAISAPQVNTLYFSCKREGLSKGTSRDMFFFYDEGYNFISLTNIFGVNGEATDSITVPKGAKYLSIRLGIVKAGETVYYSNFMLSGENIPYEQYKESATYTNLEIVSLPNGVKNSLNLHFGEYQKNIETKNFNDIKEWVYLGTGSNSYAFNLKLDGCLNIYPVKTTSLILQTEIPLVTEWLATNESLHYYIDTIAKDTLVLIIPKNLLDSYEGITPLNKLQSYAINNKLKILYQLAKPHIYKINTQPLIAYQGGTVVIDPAVKESATYTSTGITLANKGLLISFIESVYKLNGSIMMPVDQSKLHISPNGTSFTIDGAKSGEIYEYVYQYDKSLTTLPTIKYSVPMDQTSQVEGNTEMIKLLMQKIDLLEEKLKALENDRLTQYEYDANGRLVKKAKQ